MCALLGLCGWGVFSLRDEARQAVAYLPEAARRLHELVAAPPDSASVAGRIAKAQEELRKGSSAGNPSGGTSDGAQHTRRDGDDERRPVAMDGSSPPDGSLLGSAGVRSLVEQGLGSILTWAGNIVVIVFLVFFLLSSGHHFRDRLVEIAGPALVITSLEGWLLTPPLLGKAERMSALTVFIGILGSAAGDYVSTTDRPPD